MHGLDLAFFALFVIPIWTVAVIFVWLEARDAYRDWRDRRRAEALIDKFDPVGRERLGLSGKRPRRGTTRSRP